MQSLVCLQYLPLWYPFSFSSVCLCLISYVLSFSIFLLFVLSFLHSCILSSVCSSIRSFVCSLIQFFLSFMFVTWKTSVSKDRKRKSWLSLTYSEGLISFFWLHLNALKLFCRSNNKFHNCQWVKMGTTWEGKKLSDFCTQYFMETQMEKTGLPLINLWMNFQ